ncbi:MAG: transposase [Alphaproteobacteria bacterium]|nr:transposase [Alphaproteobacteria bacterium]
MPRHGRFMMADVPVHVIQRGHNRAACFFHPADYRFYLEQLAELAPLTGCAVHAYCLMTNHVHLLLTPATAIGCGALMKQLSQRYVQHVNRTYRRSGTLWEGRFRSCLTQSEDYLLACYRYIELNPVRAEMVAHPRDYAWSSYRQNGRGIAGGPVTPHERYLALGADAAARAKAYRALCRAVLDPDVIDQIRLATNGGFVLGNARFQEQIGRMLGRRVVRGQPGRPRKTEDARSGLAYEG